MAEKIFKVIDGALVETPQRDPNKLYSCIGTARDGTVLLKEWTDAEQDARAAEEAAWRAGVASRPKVKSIEERVAELEALLKAK